MKKAYARNGQEIKAGHTYLFADIRGDVAYTVTAVLDEKTVRVRDGWSSTRWACNALFEII